MYETRSVTKALFISKHVTLIEIAFIYPADYLMKINFGDKTFRRNLWPSNILFRRVSPFEKEDVITKSCLEREKLDMLSSLIYILIIRSKSLRLN